MCTFAAPSVIGVVAFTHTFFSHPGCNQMFRTDGLSTSVPLVTIQNVSIAVQFLHFQAPATAITERIQVVPDGTVQSPRSFRQETVHPIYTVKSIVRVKSELRAM